MKTRVIQVHLLMLLLPHSSNSISRECSHFDVLCIIILGMVDGSCDESE